jgi:hypothetical protein
MHERGKSDSPVLPAKPSNNATVVAAEVVEGRGLAKGNTASKTRPGHSAGPGAPSALDRVRRVAQQDKDARFTALLHHVDDAGRGVAVHGGAHDQCVAVSDVQAPAVSGASAKTLLGKRHGRCSHGRVSSPGRAGTACEGGG